MVSPYRFSTETLTAISFLPGITHALVISSFVNDYTNNTRDFLKYSKSGNSLALIFRRLMSTIGDVPHR